MLCEIPWRQFGEKNTIELLSKYADGFIAIDSQKENKDPCVELFSKKLMSDIWGVFTEEKAHLKAISLQSSPLH